MCKLYDIKVFEGFSEFLNLSLAIKPLLRPLDVACFCSGVVAPFLKLVRSATPDTTKLSCLCRVRFGGVNWIPDNPRLPRRKI